MIFLKSLLFIAWNIVIGLGLVFLLRCLLFNLKSRFIFGMHIPLTPGFIIAKRDWIFNKAREIVNDYLKQAESLSDSFGYLSKWEKLIYDTVMEKVQFMDGWVLLPQSWKDKIKKTIAKAARDIARMILRSLIPKLIEQLQVEKRIDDFDEQFSSRVLRQYYNQYVHKYLIYLFLVLNLLIGITNMILYLIIA